MTAHPAAVTPGFAIGTPVLEQDNISLRFGGVHALTSISFNVLAHEIRTTIGPNGTGKSSMPNVIGGLYTPQERSIRFNGEGSIRISYAHGLIPSGAKADSGGDSQRAESLNLWRQVLGGRGHGYSDRIAGGF